MKLFVMVFLGLGLSNQAFAAAECGAIFKSERQARRVCGTYSRSLIYYTTVDLRFNQRDVRVLAYGCDCGGGMKKPDQFRHTPGLCIKTERDLWDTCATMECEVTDLNPWCTDYTNHS